MLFHPLRVPGQEARSWVRSFSRPVCVLISWENQALDFCAFLGPRRMVFFFASQGCSSEKLPHAQG